MKNLNPTPSDSVSHFDLAMLGSAKRRAAELRAAAIDDAFNRAAGWSGVRWRTLVSVVSATVARTLRLQPADKQDATCRS
jgi:hypothetical protein